jgi:glycosyltransferase involved in cell wall biosynthesis
LSSYFAIVTCRNSEANIKDALNSLKEQTIKAEYIIVINDGSTDKTDEIIINIRKQWENSSNSISLYVITHQDLGYDIKRLVRNWNEAIELTRDKDLQKTDYHMIATDDSVYSKDYAQSVIEYMDSNPNVAIASGNYTNYNPVIPSGAGRFVRNSFFETTCWKGFYPQQVGCETAIIYEANRRGYECVVLNNLRFSHTRPLGMYHKYYAFGVSMRTLGYHPIFAFARFLKYFVTGKIIGRMGACYMLYFYLTFRPKSEGYYSMYSNEIRQYVRTKQIDRFKKLCLTGSTRKSNQAHMA